MMRLILLLFFLKLSAFAIGQDFLGKKIDFNVVNLPINLALDKLASQTNIDIAYSKNFFRNSKPITIQVQQRTIDEILKLLLAGTEIDFETLGENRVLLFKKKIVYQTISGYIEDGESGERIVGSRVFVFGTNYGAISNEYGFFSFNVPVGTAEINVRAIGYKSFVLALSSNSSPLKLKLEPVDDLPEVIVNADAKFNELSNSAILIDQDNIIEISPKLLKVLPTLNGNADFVRLAQMIPGVQGQADGFGGINIRGGESGQNLMLMDGTPIYIPYHLLGLYSTYNPETVKSLKLVSGNFPARYGDAVSAILDVQIREGDKYKWKGSAEANLLNGGLCLEGPFKNKKGSVLIAGRFSPIAYYFEPVLNRLYFQNQIDELKANFFDFNLKANYEFSAKDHVFFSAYTGRDVLFQKSIKYYDDSNKEFSAFDLKWQNAVGSFRWNHLFSNKFFINSTLTYSSYSTQFTSQSEFQYEDVFSTSNDFFLIDNRSENSDLGLKIDADYSWKTNHTLRFGGNYNYKNFEPRFYFLQETTLNIIDDSTFGENLYDVNNVYQSLNTPEYNVHSLGIYMEDHITFKRWYINAGLRISGFIHDNVSFINPEPRLLVKYRINEFLTTTLSANRRIQYLHLIANPSLQLPNDLWLPSGKSMNPQELYEYDLALQYRPNTKLRFNLSAYQRFVNHIYGYPETFDFLFNTDDYSKFDFLVNGKGKSEGIEFMADYGDSKRGAIFSYTLSKSTRQFNTINGGLPYAANFDSRHQFKLAYHQNLSKSFRFAVDWVFRTPLPQVNIVQVAFSGVYSGIDQGPPGSKNTLRSTAYNRIDINLQYNHKGEKFNHTFNLGIYNVLNSANTAFYQIDGIDPQTEQFIFSPIKSLPILPSFSYKIHF